MDGNNARFQWRLCLAPLGFEIDCPTADGILPIFFPMPPAEARGLVLALGHVSEVQPLLKDEVIIWLARRAAGECAADAEFLAAAGVVAE